MPLYDECHRKLNTSLSSKSEQMHLFTTDSILEEDVFTPRNLDGECETIGQLLFEYGEKFIEPALSDGMYSMDYREIVKNL